MSPPRWHSILLLVAMVVSTSAVSLPWHGAAQASGLAAGVTVAGDFRGNGRAQMAAVYDLDDDLGLRIDLLEHSGNGAFTRTPWVA